MPKHLCLSATLLTKRYHPDEWPPSPARAFQALLAGVMTGGYRVHGERAEATLKWLEALAPPNVISVPRRQLANYRLAVPNNDFDVVAREWAKGKPADPAKLRTLKTVSPTLLPRAGPHVHYIWDVGQQPEAAIREHAAALKTVSHCLHTLGWGVDMAFADVELLDDTHTLDGERWQRGPTGKLLMVPVPGFFDDLKQSHDRFVHRTIGAGVNPDTRPATVGFERYQKAGARKRPYAAFDLLHPETQRPVSRAAHESMLVAAWLRHAAATALRPLIGETMTNEYVLGHVEQGDRSDRLSFVPLPSVGHRNVDGRIRRVIIVEPAESEGKITELVRRSLVGAKLVPEGARAPVCVLAPSEDRMVQRYIGSGSLWRSVTPVILHGFNMQRGQISLRKTERLLVEAFGESGYPIEHIRSVSIQPSPLVAGSASARDVLVPRHLCKWPRYHVAVEFAVPIEGPVIVGIGRHYGIGLFVPVQ